MIIFVDCVLKRNQSNFDKISSELKMELRAKIC